MNLYRNTNWPFFIDPALPAPSKNEPWKRFANHLPERPHLLYLALALPYEPPTGVMVKSILRPLRTPTFVHQMHGPPGPALGPRPPRLLVLICFLLKVKSVTWPPQKPAKFLVPFTVTFEDTRPRPSALLKRHASRKAGKKCIVVKEQGNEGIYLSCT